MEEKGVAPKGFYHFMVNKFTIEGKSLPQKSWPREIKIAKKIYNLYPYPKFWNQLDLGFKLNSLAWFLTKEGGHSLKVHFKIESFSPKRKKGYALSKKVGKNKNIIRKNNSLMDFLNE